MNENDMLRAHQRPPDQDAAREWLEKATGTGQTNAMIELAVLLQNADPPDRTTALTWWRRAADAGYSEAMTYLGAVHYRQSPPDLAGAMHWCKLGAEAGNPGDWQQASELLGQAASANLEHAPDYRQAMSQDPVAREQARATLRSLADDDYARTFLGVAALRSGDRDQARAMWAATAQENDNSLATVLLKR